LIGPELRTGASLCRIAGFRRSTSGGATGRRASAKARGFAAFVKQEWGRREWGDVRYS